MADRIKLFRTAQGDLPADYEFLVNLPKINGQELIGDVEITASVTDEDKQEIIDEILASFTDASEVPM